MVRLTLDNGALRVQSPYNPDFVAAIKSLPAADRKFDPRSKAWLVDAKHGAQVAQWVAQYYHESVRIPAMNTAAVTETVLLEVRYIGTVKDRGDGCPSAFGWVDGEWNVILPEAVLKAWFMEPPTADASGPADAKTLYSTLGVGEQVAAQDLKSAYRRLAKQWHPDVCQEPDAKEQFQALQHAYDILSQPNLRARYDAGLKLERSLPRKVSAKDYMAAGSSYGYRSPLRCGLLLVEATRSLGRWKVSGILQWEDILDGAGKTLVASWPMGAKRPTEMWA